MMDTNLLGLNFPKDIFWTMSHKIKQSYKCRKRLVEVAALKCLGYSHIIFHTTTV